MERSDIKGGLRKTSQRNPQQAAIHYFEGGTPQLVFAKTLDSLWTQAQAIFGEDAAQVISNAVHSDDPMGYVENYLPASTATTTA